VTEPRTHPYGVVIPDDPDKQADHLPVIHLDAVEGYIWDCPTCRWCVGGFPTRETALADHVTYAPARSAPVEPHAPTSGPDRAQPVSGDPGTADGHTEAYDAARARLLMAICDEAPCWTEDLGNVRTAVVSVSDAAAVAARLVVAYGDERAAQARAEGRAEGEAERDALAAMIVDQGTILEGTARWLRSAGAAQALRESAEHFRSTRGSARIAEVLEARADEMGPRP
jgi:hypothetical protein